jgi:hypothetical protein
VSSSSSTILDAPAPICRGFFRIRINAVRTLKQQTTTEWNPKGLVATNHLSVDQQKKRDDVREDVSYDIFSSAFKKPMKIN